MCGTEHFSSIPAKVCHELTVQHTNTSGVVRAYGQAAVEVECIEGYVVEQTETNTSYSTQCNGLGVWEPHLSCQSKSYLCVYFICLILWSVCEIRHEALAALWAKA